MILARSLLPLLICMGLPPGEGSAEEGGQRVRPLPEEEWSPEIRRLIAGSPPSSVATRSWEASRPRRRPGR